MSIQCVGYEVKKSSFTNDTTTVLIVLSLVILHKYFS